MALRSSPLGRFALGESVLVRRRLSSCICSSSRTVGGNVIKVVVNGICKDVGKAAVLAVTKARGMVIGGAVDSLCVGQDAGEVAGLQEPLEVPILNDLVLVLGSLSQSTSSGVMVDFSTDSSVVYDNVRQATAFGMRSVVFSPGLDSDVVNSLTSFCEKASMGCVIAPTLSIGVVLLQQAATAAAFHYRHVEIIESRQDSQVYPTADARLIAESLSGLGQVFNDGNFSNQFVSRGDVVGDGVRIHSLAMPSLLSSLEVRFSGQAEVFTLRHDASNFDAMMPGLLLSIRRVLKLKTLVYGLEKIL